MKTNIKDQGDVEELSRIIREQRALGASVSNNLDSYEYTWDPYTGRLTGIVWGM